MLHQFPREDITFYGGRAQDEILKEIQKEEPRDEGEHYVPVSRTPEQIILFLQDKIKTSSNTGEKSIYSTLISFVLELQELRKYHVKNINKVEDLEEYDNGLED